jgi:hypothetical protein
MIEYRVTFVIVVGGNLSDISVSKAIGQVSNQAEYDAAISPNQFIGQDWNTDLCYRKLEYIDPDPTIPFDPTGWDDVTPEVS